MIVKNRLTLTKIKTCYFGLNFQQNSLNCRINDSFKPIHVTFITPYQLIFLHLINEAKSKIAVFLFPN